MESLGNKLKEARESKGYTCDYISRETNIALRYLEALEKEDFSVFPGEPYLLGFLKNYSEYLGLNPAELLSLYRALKIQEQPVPVEQLLHSPSPLPKILLGVFITLLVLGGAAGGYLIFRRLHLPGANVAPTVREAVEYVMNASTLERRFYRGDSILIPSGNDQFKLELTGLGEVVILATPEGEKRLDLSQELRVDLNRDGAGELRIVVADFVKHDAAAGALIRFELENFSSPAGEIEIEVERAGNTATENAAANIMPANTGLSNAVTIFPSSGSAYPFTLQAAFQGYCMFRYEILSEPGRRGREEKYFQRSEELSISQAQNGIRLWASNARAVKLQVIGDGKTEPIELGTAGEVVVAEIRWVRDDDGRYRLVLIRLE
ncbi:transcriptional regulator [Spirochaetia bacterium]|nr:transcriptional regulator [Spirochaetia bacterium]